ncbi:MAG: hypothetical protein E7369_05655 [Clostridiales bacterium]|nr:hypothetical protein [Clostridiales bacterium]
MKMYAPAVWGKDYLGAVNSSLLFRLVIPSDKDVSARLDLSCRSVYKVIFNGTPISYGPERTAHGYNKVDKIPLKLSAGKNVIVVEVLNPYVTNYYLVKEQSYFCAEVYVGGEIAYATTSFKCYLPTDRVVKTQRYSIQRAFAESFDCAFDRTGFYNGDDDFPEVETVSVEKANLLGRDCPYAKLTEYSDCDIIERGTFTLDETLKKITLPSLARAEIYEAFDCDEILTDTVSSFKYTPNKKGGCEYVLYDFKKELSGFINLKLTAETDAEVYVLFDELITKNESGNIVLDAGRLDCANVIKWKLKKGDYTLNSFEPYSLKYLKVCVKSGKVNGVTPSITLFENPDGNKFKSKIGDKKLDLILKSAKSTFMQNSVDMLIDCPSRERAGWINDAWFSRYNPFLFAGNGKALQSLLRAYSLSSKIEGLPDGMIPMCYPSDFPTNDYITACGMWYVMCLNEYRKVYGDDVVVKKSHKMIKDFLKYLKQFQNEYSLLEDIKGWVFVEWSLANTRDHICGVNFPTNMMYYKTLLSAGEILGDESLITLAKTVKENILKLSFNGVLFEDNAIRENGVLTLKGHLTEVCQYYAFDMGVADFESHKDLYDLLIKNFVPGKPAPKKYQSVGRANIIIGLCIRQKLLIRQGDTKRLIKEVKDIYYPMAEKTQTLWEHHDSRASCNHGIAAFAGISVVFALTGYLGVKDGVAVFKKVDYDKNCRIVIPYQNTTIKVTVKNKTINIESKKIPYKFI